MTEREKMLAGMRYMPSDPELEQARKATMQRLHRLLALPADQSAEYRQAVRALCPRLPDDFTLVTPFFCDYGDNILAGRGCFVNGGCTFLDEAEIRLGDRVLIGPDVRLLTAQHPLDAADRATGVETAAPIVIGDDCWLGGGVTVCPGVTIGPRTVVGAGSVVTHDLPPDCVAAGVPARVMHPIPSGHTP